MKNDLVKVVNNQAVVSSLQVAESFGKRHDHVLRDIENLIQGISKTDYTNEGDLPNFGDTPENKMFYKTTYIQEQNKQEYPMYLMNRDGFSLLVMGFTGEKALKWKVAYIKAFNEMEKALADITSERKIGKVLRRSLTDAIKEFVPESPHKKFVYKNFTDLVYKTALGKSCKKLKEEKGLDKNDNLRDFLSDDELKEVSSREKFIDSCLELGMEYEDIKQMILQIQIKRLLED